MKEHTFQVLEYHHLLEILSNYATCPMGRLNCLNLNPSNDFAFIDNELRLVSEMRLLLKAKGFVSLSDLNDILPLLSKSSTEGSYLEPNELLYVLNIAQASQHLKNYLESQHSLCPRMFDLGKDIPAHKTLVKSLKGTISSNGAIEDSASPALKIIRKKKIRLRSTLQKKLENIQKSAGLCDAGQDNLITVRDGRYVIALRTDQKSRIGGIIHDYSNTRVTCFLEPFEAIGHNNRMAELNREEKDEERRILIRLTKMVSDVAEALEYSQAMIGRLDGLYARARFSERLSCVMPEIAEKTSVELKGARNPILLAMALDNRQRDEAVEEPVPVDILLDEKNNILVISGPNRGGKTVTLKTLGLMGLMTQAGIHIPAAEGSRMPVFNEIMADIGDDQDIQAGLSTFSAHTEHLNHIIGHADHRSLVIIDEPGMGTDPDEGASLAMAVLDFLSQQGAFAAISTHLNRLKSYGVLNEKVTNACVEFDRERRRPTFEIRYGSPGISHGLEIAKEMGIPLDIIARASGYLDHDEVRLNRLIEKLNRLMTEADREKMMAEEVKRKYHAETKKIEDKLIALEEETTALLEEKRIEAEDTITEAREELKQAINLLKDKKEHAQAFVTNRYDAITNKLRDYLAPETSERAGVDLKEIQAGQLVYHRRLNQKGIVQSVDPVGGRAYIMLGKIKVAAEIQDLEMAKEEKKSGSNRRGEPASWDLTHAPTWDLNVIGYRVEEAIPLIDKTIDRALVNGQTSLRIIHGFGTGRLRQAIRSHLRDVPFVKACDSADLKVGGGAITIVDLS